MAKSIKLQDDTYLDTSSIAHDTTPLKDIVDGFTVDISRTDLNSYTDKFIAGYGHNLTNTPSTNLNLGHLVSIPRHDEAGYVTQLFSPYGTTDLYIRKCDGGTWGAWENTNRSKSCIMATIKSNATFSNVGAWSWNQLVLNNVTFSVGNKFTLNSDGTISYSGDRSLRVTMQVWRDSSTTAGGIYMFMGHDSTVQCNANATVPVAKSIRVMNARPKIAFYVNSTGAGNIVLMGHGTNEYTHVLIEER